MEITLTLPPLPEPKIGFEWREVLQSEAQPLQSGDIVWLNSGWRQYGSGYCYGDALQGLGNLGRCWRLVPITPPVEVIWECRGDSGRPRLIFSDGTRGFRNPDGTIDNIGFDKHYVIDGIFSVSLAKAYADLHAKRAALLLEGEQKDVLIGKYRAVAKLAKDALPRHMSMDRCILLESVRTLTEVE